MTPQEALEKIKNYFIYYLEKLPNDPSPVTIDIKKGLKNALICTEIINKALSQEPKECTWTIDAFGCANTSCLHYLEHQESFVSCPYCGKKIRIKDE